MPKCLHYFGPRENHPKNDPKIIMEKFARNEFTEEMLTFCCSVVIDLKVNRDGRIIARRIMCQKLYPQQ